MSNKRVIVRELKQKQKRQRQITLASVVGAALLIIAIFVGYGVYQDSLRYIMTFEGERISVSDFMYAMLATGDSTMDTATVKQNAQSLLLESFTLAHHAKDEGMALTEEEQADMLSFAANLRASYSSMGYDFSFISDQRIADLMSTDTWYSKLLESNTADYVVDEADFATALADYKENQKASYYDIELKYIEANTSVAINDALAALTDDNFDEIAERYAAPTATPAPTETPAEGEAETETEEAAFTPPTATILGLSQSGVGQEVIDEVLGLEVGGRTGVVTLADESTGSGMYVIFEVVKYEIPSDEEVETNYREQYTDEKKTEIFEGILNTWVEEANYTINQRAYDAV